nr:ORF2 [Astroviridae sp.]
MAEASAKPKAWQRKEKVTIEPSKKEKVVISVKETQEKKPGQARRWSRNRHPKNQSNSQTRQTARVETKKILRKEGLNGPRSRFSVLVSATIGKVGPNKNQGPELQISTFLHPALLKEPNDGTNFGPLQAAAAQWGLWKLSYLAIKFFNLFGASAVTGSVVRASLNLTQSPGNTSWGGLGARKHLDIPVGKAKTWKLHVADLAGPRQGWWFTDTNEEGAQSCGPMLEVHELGKTSSTYQDKDWDGDLFIVEVSGKWHFANYNAKPALGTLDRVTEESQVQLSVNQDNNIVMTIPQGGLLARHMSEPEVKSSNATSTGQTIWQIVDQGANLIASAAPPPYSWLIKGGWWFVKKLFGAANSGQSYILYASLADAQNDRPAVANPGYNPVTVTTTLVSTQINTPNTGPSSSNVIVTNPYVPTPLPEGVTFYVTGLGTRLMNAGTSSGRSALGNAVQMPWVNGYGFRLRRGAQVISAITNGLVFDQPPLTYNYVQDDLRATIHSVFDIRQSTPIPGFNLFFHTAAGDVNVGELMAFYHEQWPTTENRLVLSCYLFRTTAQAAQVQGAPNCYLSAPVLGNSSEQAPVSFNSSKFSMPRVTDQTIRFNGFGPGKFVVGYVLGNQQPEEGTPTQTIQPTFSTVNDIVLSAGFQAKQNWDFALTSAATYKQPFTFVFNRPARVEDPMLDRIMREIQGRYRLTPLDADSDFTPVTSDSESDVERDETIAAAPAPSRRSPWVNVKSKKNNRGHAE